MPDNPKNVYTVTYRLVGEQLSKLYLQLPAHSRNEAHQRATSMLQELNAYDDNDFMIEYVERGQSAFPVGDMILYSYQYNISDKEAQ